MSDHKIYHFLSSAARRQYAEDIIRVLALPIGARLRFRYKIDLLANDVREDIRSKNIVGSKCVISFLKAEKGEPPNLVPCRAGKIIQAGFFGPFAVIEFDVGDFLFSPNTSEFTNELGKSCDDNIPKWVSKDGKVDLDGYWVFSTRASTTKIDEAYDFSVFSNTVLKLSTLSPFNEEKDASLNPFFHVIFLEEGNRPATHSFSDSDLERSIKIESGWLYLKPGGKYSMRIHHFFHQPGKEIKTYSKKMALDLDGLAPRYPVSQKLRISSEYDVKDVTFRAISNPLPQRKQVTISLENAGAESDEAPFADIQIPVKVGPAIAKGIALSVAIAVGVAAPAAIGASGADFLKYGLMLFFGLFVGISAVYGLRSGL